MHLCAKKKKKGNKRAAGKRKWEGVRGIVEEEEQWSEKWERYWGSLVRHFRRRRQCDDGWRGKWWMRRRERERGGKRKRERGREREREQLCCSWHLHRKHLGKLSIRRGSLDWFSPLFNQHFTPRPSLPPKCAPVPTLGFSLHPLCYTPGPKGDHHIDCPWSSHIN